MKISFHLLLALLLSLGAVAQKKCDPGDPNGGCGCPSGNCPPGGGFSIPYTGSKDPNKIVGPAGYDTLKKWVAARSTMPYTIYYENDPKFATAPAQKVVVYLPIDPKINPNSLRIGNFGFGSFNFTVPDNTTTYTNRLDVRDSLGVYVDVTAGLDVTNRRAFWFFQSIDPVTGLASTLAANVGYLPVNDSITRRGEGYVSLTLRSINAVVTGDTATAQAAIAFDTEDTLKTNTWVNTIDAVAPISKLNPLPDFIDSVFTLKWTGRDDTLASGIKSYALYYSKNGGPYTLYQADIKADSVSFTGDIGAAYQFYTIATDNAGNKEVKTVGEQGAFVKGNGVFVSAKSFLQGGYAASTGLMTDSLRILALLPDQEPYRGLGFAPVNTIAREKIRTGVLDSTGNNALTDWVWVELRQSANPALVAGSRAALIRRDGQIVDMDGISPVYFSNITGGNYYIVIRHRNHFGVATAAPLAFSRMNTTSVDFSNPATATYGTNAQTNVNGVMTMWAGDINRDGKIKYNGAANDKTLILSRVGVATPNNIITGYDSADLNLDGKVKYNGAANDKTIILINVGVSTPNNILVQQLF